METSCSVPSKEMQSLLDQSANANLGNATLFLESLGRFLGFIFVFKGCVATANSSTVELTSSSGLFITGSHSAP